MNRDTTQLKALGPEALESPSLDKAGALKGVPADGAVVFGRCSSIYDMEPRTPEGGVHDPSVTKTAILIIIVRR